MKWERKIVDCSSFAWYARRGNVLHPDWARAWQRTIFAGSQGSEQANWDLAASLSVLRLTHIVFLYFEIRRPALQIVLWCSFSGFRWWTFRFEFSWTWKAFHTPRKRYIPPSTNTHGNEKHQVMKLLYVVRRILLLLKDLSNSLKLRGHTVWYLNRLLNYTFNTPTLALLAI